MLEMKAAGGTPKNASAVGEEGIAPGFSVTCGSANSLRHEIPAAAKKSPRSLRGLLEMALPTGFEPVF
jgi:hypothetical protein